MSATRRAIRFNLFILSFDFAQDDKIKRIFTSIPIAGYIFK